MKLENIPVWTDKYEFAKFQGASWIKLFYHKVNQPDDFFEEATDALKYTNTQNKYSIIGEYDSIHRYDETKYEFLLYYPELSGFNRWSQTNFPTEENDSSEKVTAEGHQNISISWTDNFWGGLVGSNNQCTLFEGSIGSGLVYYSIAFKKECGEYGVSTMPSYRSSVHEVYWWMRVKDFYVRQKTCHYRTTLSIKYFFISLLFK